MERNRLLAYAVLQVLPILILPPSMLFSTTGIINMGTIYMLVAIVVIFGLLGWGLMRGRDWALTLSIFIQGMNVIVRLMMVFPNAATKLGVWDITFVLTFLVSIIGSAWLMLRLDRPDIRSTTTA